MTVKQLKAELEKWDDAGDVWLYHGRREVEGIGIWPPDSTLTEPEHVIEIPS